MIQMIALYPMITQLNCAGKYTITIENQDQFLHLHNSYLFIQGDALKADNTGYTDADLVVSVSQLTLAGQMVEHVNYHFSG